MQQTMTRYESIARRVKESAEGALEEKSLKLWLSPKNRAEFRYLQGVLKDAEDFLRVVRK